MTDRILAALADRPEGLTHAQLRTHLPPSHLARDMVACLEAMTARDEVWRLPLTSARGQELNLYFIPDRKELQRHRRRERRTA